MVSLLKEFERALLETVAEGIREEAWKLYRKNTEPFLNMLDGKIQEGRALIARTMPGYRVQRRKKSASGNRWRPVPPWYGGGRERPYGKGRIHEHWLRKDKHMDNEHPAKNPVGHLRKDVFGRCKRAPIAREWTYRYRMINGRKRLVMIRKEGGHVKIKIVK